MSDRLLELMTEQTERPLSRTEEAELHQLLQNDEHWEADDFELAAAAVQLAFVGRAEAALPEHLAQEILAQATFDTSATAEFPAKVLQPPAPVIPIDRAEPKKTNPALVWGGWLAAAAAILIAFFSWWLPRPEPVSLADERLAMLAREGVVRVAWSKTDDPASTRSGDVVWDPATQTGYLRFEGLAKNDPAREQYQLWIFDATRDQAHPVDGGVFDSEEGVTIVPIAAKLRVFEPSMFAVTVEKPGGVVVSKRERIVALAKVEG